MILCGLIVDWHNCAGASAVQINFFEANDIHEAAVATLKHNWSGSFQGQNVKSGEFHDTTSQKTWSVDRGGHTQKDYRHESEQAFRSRWNKKTVEGKRWWEKVTLDD